MIVKKARRSAYSLLGGGFHGHNGLDVETMVHLYKIYISPVLLYGLELILPTTSSLTLLENFQKKLLKQILSLPTCVADITVNILTGILPIEAQVHIRALGLFNNICNQPDDSVGKSLAKRQLIIKNDESSSWFIAIKHMLRKYDLQEASWYLNNPIKKTVWTSTIKKTIYNHWNRSIVQLQPLYKGLNFLTTEKFENRKYTPSIQNQLSLYYWYGKITSKIKATYRLVYPSEQKDQNVQRWYWSEMSVVCKGRRKYRTLYFEMWKLENSEERHTSRNNYNAEHNGNSTSIRAWLGESHKFLESSELNSKIKEFMFYIWKYGSSTKGV